MNRRKFLQTSTAVAVASGVPHAASALAPRARKAAGRDVLPINGGWRYTAQATPEAHLPGFDDSGFTRVVVPHTNLTLPWHGFDDKDHEFVSLYRRRLKVPESAAGNRVFVDFEGAMVASTVYLNGKPLGEYRGGYTPFTFELTDGLASNGDNLLSVQVDSAERKDIPPFGHEVDYLTFGGIYREVALRIVPSVFLERERDSDRKQFAHLKYSPFSIPFVAKPSTFRCGVTFASTATSAARKSSPGPTAATAWTTHSCSSRTRHPCR